MICINCDQDHGDKFCPNCGEKADTKKISFASMSEEALSTLTNMDKGFLYNLRNLSTNPNLLISSYIDGKRKNIFNPISYFLISITIYILVVTSLKVTVGDNVVRNESESAAYIAGKFIYKYFNYFWGSSILWLSLSSKLIFGKYNFAEHLTINSFIIGQATLAGVISYLVYRMPVVFDPVVFLIIMILMYQVYKNTDNKGIVLLKSFFTLILFFILIFVVTMSIGKILLIYDITL